MAYDRFMIAPFETGLQTDVRKWQIMDDAFSTLNNAYVFRGRVRKRFGSQYTGYGADTGATQLNSRVSVAPGYYFVGTTNGSGNLSGTIPASMFNAGTFGQTFVIGANTLTVGSLGTPVVMTSTGTPTPGTKTFNTTTGAYVIVGSNINTPVYFNANTVGIMTTTDGSGNIKGIVPGSTFAIGQQFSIGTEIFTVVATGTPGVMLRTGASTVHTFNTTTGEFNIQGSTPSTALFFYPSTPIMGLTQYQVGSVNNYPSFAFDTQFAYKFSGGYWIQETVGFPVWHGNNAQFFWDCSWTGITANLTSLFVTNFNATLGAPGANDDPLWTYDGTTWATFKPYFAPAGGAVGAGPFVQTARIILPFKDRLVLLNTVEQASSVNTGYVNRCRFSHNGSPFAANAWYEPNQADSTAPTITGLADGGGYIDAATEEQIVSAEFIKDRLIVYFERSTWELAYTGNQVLPFVWQKLNTELGSEATFSSVPFDKYILTIGNTGVHACNGSNVERIDDKIPQAIFQVSNLNQGTKRVAGIRDFYTELVYWTFPGNASSAYSQTFPNRVLVYNYKNNSWSFNDDCFTAFSYFQQQQDSTWELSTTTWEQSNFSWNSAVVQSNFRNIIAGTPNGFIVIINPEIGSNAQSLPITNILTTPATQLTIINHTLNVNDYLYIQGAQGITGLNNTIVKVLSIVNANTINIGNVPFTGVYTGAGTAARVSNIDIWSKQWNPYVEKGRNVYVAKIDFGVVRTTAGQVTVDYYSSAADLALVNEAEETGAILGNNVLETSAYTTVPYELVQDRLWHPVYFQGDGECIQIRIYMSDNQMRQTAVAFSLFELEAVILNTMPSASRLQ